MSTMKVPPPAATLILEDAVRKLVSFDSKLKYKEKLAGLIPMGSDSPFGNFPAEYRASKKREGVYKVKPQRLDKHMGREVSNFPNWKNIRCYRSCRENFFTNFHCLVRLEENPLNLYKLLAFRPLPRSLPIKFPLPSLGRSKGIQYPPPSSVSSTIAVTFPYRYWILKPHFKPFMICTKTIYFLAHPLQSLPNFSF
jgi:hypothetical protein